MTGASPTAADAKRPGRATRRRIATVVAVLTACAVLGGCSFPVLYSQQMNTNPGGDGAFDPARLPQAARPYEQWITKAGALCEEATPEIVAGVINVENGSWNPRVNEGKTGNVALGLAQFLRGTWDTYGVDADGNGTKDIFNAADAILSAGNYLCHLADVVRGYLKDGRIPNVSPPGTETNVRDLMIVGYNKGEGIWLRTEWNGVKINFDSQGIPDAKDGLGTTGQEYLRAVNAAIDGFRSPGSGGAPVGGVRKRMVDAALREVGTTEVPPGSNCQKYKGNYQWCYAWCAVFASWIWKKGGFTFESTWVKDFYTWGRQNGSYRTDFRGAQPGDVVIYFRPPDDYYHIGVIIQAFPDGMIETVEGNSTGDAVAHHTKFAPSSRGGIGYVAPITGK
ncbi:lytic murein transglycosylase [Yinghuangia sp. ASG 101]|uniref:CHAP domain-containing protein n=1 Tax=Yinghuangia sp. ASG 101 TaxID=2896848 RepID=UPI001E506258|nr:CHAP domain-containing protein [Yinghuangia sp. ASG 101]UGQ09026.1 lytic murein transglycosylase [Yinghuangia sp. ASG 101]